MYIYEEFCFFRPNLAFSRHCVHFNIFEYFSDELSLNVVVVLSEMEIRETME